MREEAHSFFFVGTIFPSSTYIYRMKTEKEVKPLNFDIIGQKAYISYGPYQNQLGVVQEGNGPSYTLEIGNQVSVSVELKDLVLVDVDYRKFHEWCEQNGI